MSCQLAGHNIDNKVFQFIVGDFVLAIQKQKRCSCSALAAGLSGRRRKHLI